MALDTLEIFGDEFTNVTGIKAVDNNNQIKTYIRPQGTKTISAGGTGIDVTEYESVDVATGTAGTPTATKGTVSAHRVTVTPSVTNTTGYITGGTKTGTAVSVSASELVSGNLAITSNGTGINVANYATASVSVTPKLREVTIVPTDAIQVLYPNSGILTYTLKDYVVTYYESYSKYSASKTISSNLVSGKSYYVSGECSVGYKDGSRTWHTYTVGGEWVCGQSLLPLIQGTYQIISGLTITPTSYYASTSEEARVDVNLQFYEPSTETYDGFSQVTVNAASGTVGTKTVTNSSATATSLAFTRLGGEPSAFFLKLNEQLTRNSSYSYYYITAVRYNGTNTHGSYWRMSNGTFYDDTTHYSFTYSNGTLTVKSSGARGSAGGSFYNGEYELTYIY